MILINKNTTNGFITKEYQDYLKNNQNRLKEIVVCGCCTDICVMNYVLSQANYNKQQQTNTQITVPMNAVETYHQEKIYLGRKIVPEHLRNDCNARAFREMQQAGVQLVKKYVS